MRRRKKHFLYGRYLSDQRTKLFRFCTRFNSLGIFILAAAAGLDLSIYGCRMAIPLRIVPAVLMLTLIIACRMLRRKMLPFLSIGHGAVLVLLIGMELGRVFLAYHLPGSCRIEAAEAVTGLIVLMFIVFLFSYHLRRYVPLIIAGPYVIFLAVVLFFSQLRTEGLVMLIYPTGFLILLVPITSFIEKGFFHEFWLRLIAERRREKLQEELSRVEELNTKLEDTKEALEREIEERKQIEHRLEYLAAYDELTGVYNRRAGIELLKHSLEVARRRGIPLPSPSSM